MKANLLSNGNGSYFLPCHVCHATSPGHHEADDLRVLANAQKAGWQVKKAGEGYRLFCDKPKCQKQA